MRATHLLWLIPFFVGVCWVVGRLSSNEAYSEDTLEHQPTPRRSRHRSGATAAVLPPRAFDSPPTLPNASTDADVAHDIEVETAAVASEEPGEELAFTEEEEEAPASTAANHTINVSNASHRFLQRPRRGMPNLLLVKLMQGKQRANRSWVLSPDEPYTGPVLPRYGTWKRSGWGRQQSEMYEKTASLRLQPRGRYLRICGSYGLFANKFTLLAKAYSYAGLLNRTFVVTDTLFQHWDEEFLRQGPVTIMRLSEYEKLQIPMEQDSCPHRPRPRKACCRYVSGAMSPESKHTTLSLHARYLFHEHKHFFLLYPRHRHRFCIFKWLKPHWEIRREVKATLALLPENFLGVHLRMRNTSAHRQGCVSHIEDWAWWYTAVEKVPWKPTGDECHMPPEYVACYVNDTTKKFFVGTDNFNKTATALLTKMGGIRYKFSPDLIAVMEREEKKKKKGGADYPILVDIAILVEAGEFLGNPVSSFSALICQLRQARGKRCLNMPPDLYPGQCIAYPDNYNLFLSWTLEAGKLKPGVLA
eukprot:EG_transcript_9315